MVSDKKRCPDEAFFASKHEFHERCAKLGLGVAPYRTCRDRFEAESALAKLGFPMVAKKLTIIGGTGVINLPNRAEYDKRIGELDFPMQFQKYVAGKHFATDVFFDHGVPVCWENWYHPKQLHRWPTNFSPSTARRLIHVPEMLVTTVSVRLIPFCLMTAGRRFSVK